MLPFTTLLFSLWEQTICVPHLMQLSVQLWVHLCLQLQEHLRELLRAVQSQVMSFISTISG